MIEYKASTKAGQNLIARTKNHEGTFLHDVYKSFSRKKEKAWNDCIDMFIHTEDSEQFHIFSYNVYQFSVAWYGVKDNERILRVETANNSYLVWMER